MIYYSSKETFNFNEFKTIRFFGEYIYGGKITINEVNQEKADLLEYIINFDNKTRGEKIIALSNLGIYFTWKNIKSSCNNNKFKISAPTWNNEF